MLKKPILTPSRNANYRKGNVHPGDRYIGVRSEEQLQLATHLLNYNEPSALNDSPASKLERESKLSLMRVNRSNDNIPIYEDRVCAFRKGLAPTALSSVRQPVRVIFTCSDPTENAKRSRRHICKSPERILDAPGISDNFYASLTDWSSASVVAVALDQSIYLWDSYGGNAELLTEFAEEDSSPTLVKWSHEGQYLSVGFSNGNLKIFDIKQNRCLRSISGQSHRIACGDWMKNGILSLGTRSGRIFHHDVRIQNSLISIFDSHSHEVCGLKWSNDEKYLVTGGADAIVNTWEYSQLSNTNAQPLWAFTNHSAAVKAIEFVPFLGVAGSNIVATGGGTNDHSVRLWNLTTGAMLSSLDTGSQISAILFSKSYKEMITGHGNPKPGVRVWRYKESRSKEFEFVANLKSSDARILGLYQNPDRSYVLSTGDDETMRLWRCWKDDFSFSSNHSQSRNGSQSSVSDISDAIYHIR